MFPRVIVRLASYTSHSPRKILLSPTTSTSPTSPTSPTSSLINTIQATTQSLLNEQSKTNNDAKTENNIQRQSFKSLVQLLESNNEISNNLPNDVVKNINLLFNKILNNPQNIDSNYYIKQLKLSSNPWIKLYYLIHQKDYFESIILIKKYWNQSHDKPIIIPYQTIGILFDNLLENNNLSLFFDLYEWLITIHYPILEIGENRDQYFEKYLIKFIKKCIQSSESNSNDLLAKFFEKYILYTGPTDFIKNEVLNISDDLLESIINSFQTNGNIKEYSKSVAYYIKRLKKEKKTLLLNQWRFKSRITKFDMYINKLGPYKVLENGMFYTFKLTYNSKIKIDQHLLNFTNSLTNYLIELENPKLSLFQFIVMIEFMHGLHIQKFKESYDKSLNPDIQMARIYRSVIKKTANPDPIIVKNYTDIIEMVNDKKFTHMKDGLPRYRTLNQRFNNENNNNLNIKFESLPLELMLRVIFNLTQSVKYKNDSKNLLNIAAILFQTMLIERKVHPTQACFIELIRIVLTCSKSSDQIPTIMQIHHKMYPIMSANLKMLLHEYGLTEDGYPEDNSSGNNKLYNKPQELKK